MGESPPINSAVAAITTVPRSPAIHQWLKALGVSVPVTAVATLIRFLLDPWLADAIPWVTYFVAIFVAGLYGNRAASVLTLLLSAWLGNLLFLEPHGQSSLIDPHNLAITASFLVIGACTAFVAHRYRSAIDTATQRAADLQREVEERSRAEAALLKLKKEAQAQLAELQTIYQNAPVGLCVVDPQGHYLRVNRLLAEMNGLPEDAHLGRSIPEIVPDLAPKVEAMLADIVRTGQPVLNFELTGETRAAPGIKRTWMQNWVPLTDDSGKVYAINVVTEDVTPIIEAQEAVREKHSQMIQSAKLASIGVLAAGVAHELNNPLNNIGLYVANALDALNAHKPAEFLTMNLEAAIKQVERATNVVKQLRTFARAAPLQREPVPVNAMVESATDLLREQLRLSSISVTLRLCADNPYVQVNRTQLEQVIVNLLINARDAVGRAPSPSITVTTTVSSELATIRIHDNGPGIPPDVRPKIFDPFFTTKPVGQGTGLGLSISYGIVKEHGGTLRLASDCPEGTAFLIELPCDQQIATARCDQASSATVPGGD